MNRTHRHARLIEKVHDPNGRGRHVPAYQGDVDSSLPHRTERVVGAHQADGGPGGPLEPGDGVLCPRVGQEPTEPQADAHLLAHGVETASQLRQDPLDVFEEHASRRGGHHVPRRAVQQPHSERAFELLDGATQRRLGDAEFLGGLGEGFEACHRFERPQVTQLDQARLRHVPA